MELYNGITWVRVKIPRKFEDENQQKSFATEAHQFLKSMSISTAEFI